MPQYKTIAQSFLPDVEKQRLCQLLLDEFGVGRVQVVQRTGEMKHGCMLPGGNHHDQKRNPTGSLNYKKLTYKCLGCGQSGGLLWFIGIMRGCSGQQARQWLAKETGTDGELSSLGKLLEMFDQIYSQQHLRPEIPVMSENILKPWLKIHPYVTEIRKVPEETVMKFKVGFGDIEVSPGVFSKRIVIPHFWKGRLVGWQSRRLLQDGTAKYLSSPDFPRENTIFNYDSNRKEAVVVEAPMSVLRHHHHIPDFEGTFGASITGSQVRHLQLHRRIVLFLDNGQAGWDSAYYGIHDARGRKITPSIAEQLNPYADVRIVFNPYVKFDSERRVIWLDPADLDDHTVEKLIEDAQHYSLWHPPTTEDLVEYQGA